MLPYRKNQVSNAEFAQLYRYYADNRKKTCLPAFYLSFASSKIRILTPFRSKKGLKPQVFKTSRPRPQKNGLKTGLKDSITGLMQFYNFCIVLIIVLLFRIH